MVFPRLIALDMDGTLLDGESKIPESFWPVLKRAEELGVTNLARSYLSSQKMAPLSRTREKSFMSPCFPMMQSCAF